MHGPHALVEWLLHSLSCSWKNETLIYLGVRDENELLAWGDKLSSLDKEWFGFREPDIGNEMTALAVVDDGKLFKEMRLL